jgi:DNA-directed RNA polymerase beta' subunit
MFNQLDNPNFYTIPFRITGIYSFILVLRYLAEYWKLDLAQDLFDKKYIIDVLRITPPDLRMPKIDPERSEVRSPRVNDFYTSVLNLNKSHGAILSNLKIDEQLWMDQLNTNIKKELWDEEIVDAAVMEMDTITARYQYFINQIYQEIYDQLSGKLGLIRSSILGRTIEFSARSVIRVDPGLSPYEIKVSKKILYKLWNPYFLHYLTHVKGYDYDYCFENIVNRNYEEHRGEFNDFLNWFVTENNET